MSVAVSDVTLYVDENTGGGDTGPKDVTFSVDMTGVDLTDGNPTLQSTFNNWCGACNPMSDDDGDNIWTVTVNIPQGDHEYKYALGAWVSQESVPADCDNTLGANRAVTVTGDVTLATDVYNGCPVGDTGGGDTGGTDPELTPADGFVISEAFGGTTIGEGSVYTFPVYAESWAGFADPNAGLYLIKLTEPGTITFNASVPSGGDVDVRFRLEKNPHPDTEPSFNTDVVTVSGAETASYTINVPAQGANEFRSLIMNLDTRDIPVVITNVVVNADANISTCTDGIDDDALVIFENSDNVFEDVNLNPYWGQSTNVIIGEELILSDFDYHGIEFSQPLDLSAYENLYIDVFAENLAGFDIYLVDQNLNENGFSIEGNYPQVWSTFGTGINYLESLDLTSIIALKFVSHGYQTVMIDNLSFGNGPEIWPGENYICGDTGGADTGTVLSGLLLTVSAPDATAVRITGPWWNWDPAGGPEASDNGDGTWTVTLDPAPTENMEYLWVVDGVQENLIDNAANAECAAEIDGGALITDYSGWANRVLVVDSGDAANTYDACAGTSTDTGGDNGDGTLPTTGNLVTDGTFDAATSTTWYGNAYNPVDGVNQADIGAAGNPWDVNLSGYVNVTAGADYTLSFDVAGEAGRTIVAGIGQSVAPYLGHTDTVTLSASVQTIVMHLTAKADGAGEDFGGDTTRVIFDMGADTGAVSIDNVSLTAGHTGTVNLGAADGSGGTDPELTPADGFVITEAFGGTTIGEGSVYTYPAGTEAWAGFANTNTSLYPMTIAEDSVITFTGSVPAGGDADVRFRFEKNPHPDTEPSFNTEAVTVSGADAATYTIAVAAQGANTFSSFLLYLNTQDVGVVVTDIAISAAPAGPVDSDNDGVNDDEDAFPNDASETADTDNDGVGDNADTFPNDASETADSDNDGVGDNADFAPNDPAVQEGPKQSVFVSGSPKGMVGSPVSVTVGYDVSDADSSLTGLGLRVHYDSSVLTFVEFADVLSTDNISSGQPANDTDNEDGDASTDKYITANWASLFGNWPGSLPADLLTATFNVADDDSLVSTVINFSAASNAAGYQFDATPYTMDILSGSFDFDGNGTADALTDGLMLLRYAFNLRGSLLVGDGVVASDSQLTTAEIQSNLEKAEVIMDIDGNGSIGALSDGLLLLRYMFGLRDEILVNDVIAADASRSSAEDISQHIELYMP